MKSIYFVAAAFAVAISSASGRPNEDNVSSVDCSGKPNGNYQNPRDCTGFIACSDGVALEMSCASCDEDPVRCPSGKLVFNASTNACLWADETTCEIESASTPLPTDPPRTSKKPSTEFPITGAPADVCDPHWCKNNGTCVTYDTCSPEGLVVSRECPDRQFWEIYEPDCKTLRSDGGECVPRHLLCPSTEQENVGSLHCLHCRWEDVGECQQDYLYLAPLSQHPGDIETIKCREGNVFDPAEKLCRPCALVINRETGNSCCSNNGTLTAR